MSIQKPLYVKPGNILKPFRSIDKITSSLLSALAPIATDPTADKIINILDGIFYYKNTQITFVQTAVNFGTGIFQVPSFTIGYYRKVLVSIKADGSVRVIFGTPTATILSAVAPDIIASDVPIAIVTMQSDGTGNGGINPIAQTNILDIRSHSILYNTELNSSLIDTLRVKPKLDGSNNTTTSVTVQAGYYYGKFDELYRYMATDVGFGVGGSNEFLAFTYANYYNKVYLLLDSLGNIVTQFGTEAATLGAVGGPEIVTYNEMNGRNQMPIAVISVQNDGVTGIAGHILTIEDSEIEDIRPLFQNTGSISNVVQNEFTASGSISQYEVIGLNNNGTVSKTQAITSDFRPAIAIAVQAANDGSKEHYLTKGEVTNTLWSWANIGGKIYLSPSVNGGLVDAEPVRLDTPGIENYIQHVGRVLSATRVYFDFNSDTVTNTL